MLEDHLLLESEIGAFSGFLCPQIHRMGEADIGVSEADRVEVGALCGRLAARLGSVEKAGEVAVDVVIG